jgi:hypothetical protein
MSFLGGCATIEGVAPSVPNVPVFEHQSKQIRVDWLNPEELLEIVLRGVK